MNRLRDIILDDTEYLPSHQAREFTIEKQKENMLRYWKDKSIPDCQRCSNWDDRDFGPNGCICSWKISETEHGPRCFFYKYEFIKEEELHA